jgi:hypothetical protein
MTIDNAVKLLDAITKLLGVLLWPAVALFVLIRFGSALREFIASMGEFSLKAAGFEASAKRKLRQLLLLLPLPPPTPSPAQPLMLWRGTHGRQLLLSRKSLLLG